MKCLINDAHWKFVNKIGKKLCLRCKKLSNWSMNKFWIITAFFNLVVAASMGALLRFAHVQEVSWLNFKNMMHAHSHVAMLGWAYLTLFAMIWFWFLSEERKKKIKYQRLFWITQVAVLGMMFSFPFQGYGAVSIAFSTLHIFCSYVFCYWIWRESRLSDNHAGLLLRSALVWMALSTAGVWAMGPVIATAGRTSAMYHIAIQFFLHFQFNGWFTFAVLALLFNELRKLNVSYSATVFRWFYGLLVTSCILTFTLSVTWSSPYQALFYVNGVGVLVQVAALIVFLYLIKGVKREFMAGVHPFIRAFYFLALVSFAIKILVQAAVVIPDVAVISYTIRQFVVGFIHLIMLGSITCYLVALVARMGYVTVGQPISRWGMSLLALGFILSEILLFSQGLFFWLLWGFIPGYYEILFAVTLLVPLGLLLLMPGIIRGRRIVSLAT